MHAVILGGSRGVGYYTALNLLRTGNWSCTMLLRKPEAFTSDDNFSPYIKDGSLTVMKGDATNIDAVQQLFNRNVEVDVVITSVGSSGKFTLTGIKMDQPTLCTDSMIVLLKVLETLPKIPRVIAVSSMGMAENHHCMPLGLRILYPMFLGKPHLDKEGLEYLLQRSSTSLPAPEKYCPPETILPKSKISETKANFIPEIIIVRPAFMPGDVDEKARGPEATKSGESLYTWTVNRQDTGRFIADECMPGDGRWVNKLPVVGY